jgi:hypothetical protein
LQRLLEAATDTAESLNPLPRWGDAKADGMTSRLTGRANRTGSEAIHRIDVFDTLRLHMTLTPFVEAVVGEEGLAGYNAVFLLVLRLKRVGAALCSLWQLVRDGALLGANAHVLHRLRLHVHELRHFTSTIEEHALSFACHVRWTELLEHLEQAPLREPKIPHRPFPSTPTHPHTHPLTHATTSHVRVATRAGSIDQRAERRAPGVPRGHHPSLRAV